MSQQEATDSGNLVKARCREEPLPFRVTVAQWVKLQVWMDKNIRETKTASYCTFSNYSPFFFSSDLLVCKIVEISLESAYVYNVT
jgi:hypothetical protein